MRFVTAAVTRHVGCAVHILLKKVHLHAWNNSAPPGPDGIHYVRETIMKALFFWRNDVRLLHRYGGFMRSRRPMWGHAGGQALRVGQAPPPHHLCDV